MSVALVQFDLFANMVSSFFLQTKPFCNKCRGVYLAWCTYVPDIFHALTDLCLSHTSQQSRYVQSTMYMDFSPIVPTLCQKGIYYLAGWLKI